MAKIAATNFVTNCQKYGRIRNSNKCSKMTDFVTVMTNFVTNFRTNVLFTNFVIGVTDFVVASLPDFPSFPCFLPFPSVLPIGASLPKGAIIGVS